MGMGIDIEKDIKEDIEKDIENVIETGMQIQIDRHSPR